MRIVFIHGWGCDASYWDQLAGHLPDKDHHRIDLGYLAPASNFDVLGNDEAIYVTHSFGTMWFLQNQPQNLKALIAINGFSAFQHHADERTLKTMMLRLKRAPEKQMQEFWDVYDLPHSTTLNLPALQKGLRNMIDWDLKTELENLSCPVMSLIGRKDLILNNEIMRADWGKYELHVAEDGGHSLPVSHAQWCADKIKTFVNEL